MSNNDDLIELFGELYRRQRIQEGGEGYGGAPDPGGLGGGGGDWGGGGGGGGITSPETEDTDERKQLLRDKHSNQASHVEKHKGSYYISGKFINADVVNKNNRLYPKDVVHECVANCQKRIRESSLYSHLGHNPNGVATDPHRVSGIIESLTPERLRCNWTCPSTNG
jgi:hypothetical protein